MTIELALFVTFLLGGLAANHNAARKHTDRQLRCEHAGDCGHAAT